MSWRSPWTSLTQETFLVLVNITMMEIELMMHFFPKLTNKPSCGTSSSGVIDLTKTPSDLIQDMRKPVVKPPIDTNDISMSNNPSGSEASIKACTFETNSGHFTVC